MGRMKFSLEKTLVGDGIGKSFRVYSYPLELRNQNMNVGEKIKEKYMLLQRFKHLLQIDQNSLSSEYYEKNLPYKVVVKNDRYFLHMMHPKEYPSDDFVDDDMSTDEIEIVQSDGHLLERDEEPESEGEFDAYGNRISLQRVRRRQMSPSNSQNESDKYVKKRIEKAKTKLILKCNTKELYTQFFKYQITQKIIDDISSTIQKSMEITLDSETVPPLLDQEIQLPLPLFSLTTQLIEEGCISETNKFFQSYSWIKDSMINMHSERESIPKNIKNNFHLSQIGRENISPLLKNLKSTDQNYFSAINKSSFSELSLSPMIRDKESSSPTSTFNNLPLLQHFSKSKNFLLTPIKVQSYPVG